MGSYEFSRGAAADWAEGSPGGSTSRPFLGLNTVELKLVINISVVDNYLSFPMI